MAVAMGDVGSYCGQRQLPRYTVATEPSPALFSRLSSSEPAPENAVPPPLPASTAHQLHGWVGGCVRDSVVCKVD